MNCAGDAQPAAPRLSRLPAPVRMNREVEDGRPAAPWLSWLLAPGRMDCAGDARPAAPRLSRLLAPVRMDCAGDGRPAALRLSRLYVSHLRDIYATAGHETSAWQLVSTAFSTGPLLFSWPSSPHALGSITRQVEHVGRRVEAGDSNTKPAHLSGRRSLCTPRV